MVLHATRVSSLQQYRTKRFIFVVNEPIAWTQKVDPGEATSADISAALANFCMKFYSTVKLENAHFIITFDKKFTELRQTYAISTKTTPISQSSLLVAGDGKNDNIIRHDMLGCMTVI